MMKKISILFLLITLSTSLFAQDYDLDDVKSAFQTFADETANALPLAANMGLNWNDAYSGSFPHFGLGITGGAVLLPLAAFEEMYNLTGEDISSFPDTGIPLPMYAIDGRIGLPILPMDIGLKIGVLDPSVFGEDSDFSAGFLLIGFDARWALLKDKGLMPDVSIGAGYTRMNGNISVPVATQTVDISSVESGLIGSNLTLSDSRMMFEWGSNIFDLKAQVSKKLLLLNVSAGAGYSYGVSSAGGGLTASTVSIDGNEIDSTDITAIEDATGLTLASDGITVMSENNGGSFRLFGGVGLNLFLLKLDFGVLYGLPSKTVGLTANARIQF
jgi:hypothetical protein